MAMVVPSPITFILSFSQPSHHRPFSSLVEQSIAWVIRDASIHADAKDKGIEE
ncbi:hypothetical protein [Sphingobium yanoikuyae]|uniref:hypothetical protein n=1 Tax=Sphingobium yanoikuyae TaxID=13690 RepID=UPI00138E37A3|nr:hypothetical protein [Sphingobium yanoikuyae]